jgi:LysM repeat protein/outer membrane murein-binding lipoprotein Lpp
MRKPQGRFFQMSVAASNACHRMARFGFLWAVGFTTVLLVGCGELEPMREPEVVDLQLTTDTLRTSVRDAQRVVAELRTDLEARRRDLSEAQVARAQLEGRVREAERRVIEARQVIELQREELAAARMERGRVSRSSIQSQNQMKQLHKQLSGTERSDLGQDGQESAPRPSSYMPRKGQKAMQVPAHRSQPSEYQETQSMVVTPAAMAHMPVISESSAASEHQRAPIRHVSVKPGDTLWSIAQKYRVNMEQLRTLNQVTGNKIITGQALWLPDDSSLLGGGADIVSSMP